MSLRLDEPEARVLGSLIEKQLATPQYYPLTLNALVAACNQSNNRDPVVTYDAATVEGALVSLREKGVVRVVHPSHGSRTMKHRHVLDEVLGADASLLAVLCVLLLRGPQTPGELRGRTERLHAFASLEQVEAALTWLAERDPPLLARLDRQPGQKEARVRQLLSAEVAAPRFAVPDYVVLVVEDLDRALAFWTGTLALRLDHRSGPYAQLATGATRFALYERTAMEDTLGGVTGDRVEVGFKVDDVDTAYAELVAAGAEAAVAPTDRPWGQRTAYVRDPDGHLVELAQDGPRPG